MRRALVLVSLCCLLLTPGSGWAQAPPAASPPGSLASALARTPPAAPDIALAVGAEKIPLLPDAVLPGTSPTLSDIAGEYGRLLQRFGPVAALAPPTMTVVYSPPDTPNPYDGMPPGKVLKLLASTFTAAQWKAFFSPAGLGYADLTTDAQKSLFAAFFPGGHLVVIKDKPNAADDPKTKQDISGDALTQAHLRLGFLMSVALQAAGKPDEHIFAGGDRPENGPTRYTMLNEQTYGADREFGAQVRESRPNLPKPSELDPNTLTAPVPLAGVQTIRDLVIRIGLAQHLELYADARYAARTVILAGAAKSAPAGDLLSALALCVCGTYRKVGPAYVLTDDLVGLGTKHVLWKDFEAKAAALLPAAASSSPAASPYTAQDIPWNTAGPDAFTPAQQSQFWKKQRENQMQGLGNVFDLTLPFRQLSPAQQEVAQQVQEHNEKSHTETTLDGPIMLQAEPVLTLTLPSLDGPVFLYDSYDNLLPPPALSPAEQAAQQTQMQARMPPLLRPAPAAPSGPLRPVVQSFTRRAVRLAPRDAAELSRTLAAMKTLGFNELWLQITPDPRPAASDTQLALLTQAVQAGRADGITVLPDVPLLRWAGASPAFLDKDILGRTASEANKAAEYPQPAVSDTVTPFAPEVVARLAALVQSFARLPLGGIVWEDLMPAGYQAINPNGFDSLGNTEPLGYADAGRLALLRSAQVDPVDLYTNSYTDERAHVSVPDFDTDFDLNRALYNKWRSLRADTAKTLATRLVSRLPASFLPAAGSARRPLLVPPASEPFVSQYGSWDNFQGPLPTEEFIAPRGPDGQPLMGVPGTMQMKSAVSYQIITVYASPNVPVSESAEAASRSLRDAAQRPRHPSEAARLRNIVVDATSAPGVLEALAASEPQPATPAK